MGEKKRKLAAKRVAMVRFALDGEYKVGMRIRLKLDPEDHFSIPMRLNGKIGVVVNIKPEDNHGHGAAVEAEFNDPVLGGSSIGKYPPLSRYYIRKRDIECVIWDE